MKTLSVSLFFVLFSTSYAQDLISPKERLLDTKTNKLVRICEVKGSDIVVKEECGKGWKELPRTREQLAREVDNFKEISKNDLGLFPVKQKDGTIKMEFGKIDNIYENGKVHVLQSEAQKTGFSKGATHYTFDSQLLIKLDKKHPLLANANMCAKEDTEITYSYNQGHSYSVKKGEKVALKGIFENQTAVISLNGTWNNFWGYGLNNQLTVDLAKLEVCESDKQAISVDNTSRASAKAPASVEDSAPASDKSNSVSK